MAIKTPAPLSATHMADALASIAIFDDEDYNSTCDEEPVFAFMVSTFSSTFLTNTAHSDLWYADYTATEHMTYRRDYVCSHRRR